MNTQNPFPAPATMDGYQRISGSCSDSDQVYLFSGKLRRVVSLIDIPGVGPGLSLTLFQGGSILRMNQIGLGQVAQDWSHNLMAHLGVGEPGPPVGGSGGGDPGGYWPDNTIFTDGAGVQYEFEYTGGGGYELTSGSLFAPIELSNPGGGDLWRVTMKATGEELDFDNTQIAGEPTTKGRLIAIRDARGNQVTLNYSTTTGLLESVTDAASRAITFTYSGVWLTQVTDPRGNSYLFGHDNFHRLTSITGPEGCTLTYAYGEDWMTRTDALNHTWTYTFDEEGRLLTVTDPEENEISYTYDQVLEYIADPGQDDPDDQWFARTTLLDARGQTWDYRFTPAGQFWRIIDPLGHQRRYYWSPEGGLLYASAPFTRRREPEEETYWGPKDNLNNVFLRQVRDEQGKLLQDVDGRGLLTAYQYDEDLNVVAVSPGQATFAVQGDWRGVFGEQGHVLCAYFDESDDVVRLPAYIDSIANGDDSDDFPFSRYVPVLHDWPRGRAFMDSRLPDLRLADGQDSDLRSMGYWKHDASNTKFVFRLVLAEEQAFNLSLYTHSSDMVYGFEIVSDSISASPLRYCEQFGRHIRFTVEDLDPDTDEPRQQVFEIPNNAPGVWVTFPVHSTDAAPITVTVEGLGGTKPMLSMLAFDELEDRTTRFSYDVFHALTSVRDALGNETVLSYNTDGTLDQQTDALSRDTLFFYEDAAKNLTRVQDAELNETLMSYDENGNLLALEDADEKTQTMQYDGKNRLVAFTDGEGNRTELLHDANGNLFEIIDAERRITRLFYTPTNRLQAIVDALDQETTFDYDESGALIRVTDARGNETEFVYDNAGRLVQVNQPDSGEVRFSLDGLNRILAVTSPNANQSELGDINLLGAFNHLRNPSAEEPLPGDASRPRHWVRSSGSQAVAAVAREGSAGLPLSPTDSTTPYWSQKRIPSLAGCRYLMRGWASKAADSVEATVSMQARIRDFTSEVVAVNTSTALTLDGSSAAWAQLEPTRVDIAGDAQFVATKPPLDELRISAAAEDDTEVWLDQLEFLRLSTGYLHDGEGLREVCLPDGTRMRMERDRYGRIHRWEDPLGRVTSVRYDALDRVVAVVDPLGQETLYEYDPVSNLLSFTDARDQTTSYTYSDLDRLTRITYPDSNYEEFDYTPAGDLAEYTNARGQVRTFAYDEAHRLITVTYQTDMTTVGLTYDKVSNVRTLTERNGDVLLYQYDLLDRLTSVSRTRGFASDGPEWQHAHGYDANGNRTRFDTEAVAYGETQVKYGEALYGQGLPASGGGYEDDEYGDGTYASRPMRWEVPSPGYDSMNRLPVFADAAGQEVSFSFDSDGRRVGIAYPNGAGLETEADYDMVGRLMSLTTRQGTTEMLKLEYGYSMASERIAMRHNRDTWEYGLDKLGRLVEEAVNRMVDRSPERLALGEFERTELDTAEGRVRLLGMGDTLEGGLWNTDRWRYVSVMPEVEAGVPLYQFSLRAHQNDGIQFSFPRGGTNLVSASTPPIYDSYGIEDTVAPGTGYVYQAAEHFRKVSGDFDLMVDFADFQAVRVYGGQTNAYLRVSTHPFEESSTFSTGIGRLIADTTNVYRFAGAGGDVTTTDISGRVRLRREGTTMYAYRWEDDDWVQMPNVYYNTTTADLYVSVDLEVDRCTSSIRWRNFAHTDEGTPDFPRIGSYVSGVMDAQREVHWESIRWDETLPSGTDVEFQVAVADSPDGPFEFVGPNGHWSTRFTTAAGEALPTLYGRYFRYRAYLSSTLGEDSPDFGDVQVGFTGLQPSFVTFYEYDPAGNRTRKLVETDAGVVLEEVLDDPGWSSGDRINTLNQVMRRDVTDIGGTTSWEFTHDPDGNMTSKSDGTDTWDYTFNEDNRLVHVEGPGGLDVAFEYDSLGRMLRRVSGSDETILEWDGWDLVRETAPDGTITRYFCPKNDVLRFQRGNESYSVHPDALGSVRMITDAGGRVVSQFQYDAWGNVLPSSVDGVPGGFPYRFVGALGCRADDEVGLIWMRSRWYDARLARFISRDPDRIGRLATTQRIKSTFANLYCYAENRPMNYVDPTGRMSAEVTWYQMGCANKLRECLENCTLGAEALAARLCLEGPYGLTIAAAYEVDCVSDCGICDMSCAAGMDICAWFVIQPAWPKLPVLIPPPDMLPPEIVPPNNVQHLKIPPSRCNKCNDNNDRPRSIPRIPILGPR